MVFDTCRIVQEYYPQLYGPVMRNDLMAIPGFKEAFVATVAQKHLTAMPPGFGGNLFEPHTLICTIQIPVFFTNVTQEQLWPVQKPSYCPPGVCYNASTNTGWWGGSAITLNVTRFISPQGPMSKMAGDFQYEVSRGTRRLRMCLEGAHNETGYVGWLLAGYDWQYGVHTNAR